MGATLGNMNKRASSRGFTIVELLIVIVVIAILAAITIVAYNGIQNRAKTSAARELASQIAKKAEAYHVITSNYPTTKAAFSTQQESTLDNPASVILASPSNETTVGYQYCATSGGYRVWYRDFVAGTLASIDGGTLGGCVYPAS